MDTQTGNSAGILLARFAGHRVSARRGDSSSAKALLVSGNRISRTLVNARLRTFFASRFLLRHSLRTFPIPLRKHAAGFGVGLRGRVTPR